METANPARKGTLDYAALSGTLSGNPLACAAGVAALTELARPDVYARLHAIGRRLREGMACIAGRFGVPFQALAPSPSTSGAADLPVYARLVYARLV